MDRAFLYDLEDMVAWPAVAALADVVINGGSIDNRAIVVAVLAAALRGAMKLQAKYRTKAETEAGDAPSA